MNRTVALVFTVSVMCGCGSSGGGADGQDPGLEGLALTSVDPGTVIPGSTVVITGESFVSPEWGTARLHLEGTLGDRAVDASLPAAFVDFQHMHIAVDGDFFASLGAEDGDFEGSATVEVDSPVDDTTHVSNAIDLQLSLRQSLTPSLQEIDTGEIIYINDEIAVTGDGLLLGGDEGTTVARVEGCYTVQGGDTCDPVGPVDVPVAVSGFDRKAGAFAFAPTIAGIRPGSFDGHVSLVNQPAAGTPVASAQVDVAYDVTDPAVFSLSPGSASLGQYVDIDGGGFVGGDQGGVTLIELDGQFTPAGGDAMPVTLTLVPEWAGGGLVRYVLNEDDELGHAVDLRRVTGTFSGTVRPVVQYDADEVAGASTSFSFALAPVKQVVYLEFLPSYVESLRHFGLRALDQELRQRIAGIMQRDYGTINLEVRLERPTDFALYATVQLGGPDPNGLGLLGYDNTPGKDTGNKRLYDQIGGVNAVTQEDGSPGYGGVFVDSMFAFSNHPGDFARSVDGQASDAFDQIFDPFRPDRGGTPVTSGDLADGPIPGLDSGEGCPSDGSRRDKIACAVWVLGSLVGTTLSHEVGHSLGLANPFGEGYHDSGDEPNRLMDSGGDRPFSERAQLFGDGPGRFCDSEYDYLRQILPTSDPDDPTARPSCF